MEKIDPRKAFGKAVSEIAEKNKNIVILSADSGGSSGFGEFSKAHPERYFEFGIMEQGVVGIASGLATTGKVPVFCAIAPFVTARPFEMLRNDCGYMKQNVKIVGRNGGITYSDLGATHHSLEDYAIMRMIPGMVVLAPQDPSEIIAASKAMLEYNGPVYMRIGNEPQEVFLQERQFEIGKGQVLCEGSDMAIISTGLMTAKAVKAAEKLREQGIAVQVVGMPTISPVDSEIIVEAARKTGRIITVEEHYTEGGLGSIVTEVCSEEFPVPVKRLGIPKVYATSGPYEEILSFYGLDVAGIVKAVRESLSGMEYGNG